MRKPIRIKKLSPRNRKAFLQVLRYLEKGTPDKIYHINLFNTGFIINSHDMRNRIISLLKRIIKNKVI